MADLTRRIAGALYRRMAPRGVRNLIASQLILTARDRVPERIKRFDDGPVLIVAPHFDDEICGCGGVMGRHAEAGTAITVVFVTDGGAGDPDLREAQISPEERTAARRKLSELREAESRAACAEYGVDDIVLLNGPDGALQPTASLVEAMRAVLERVAPAIVYHPSLMDAHADHWASNRILGQALAACPALAGRLRLRGYEVWTPTIPNRLADITGELPRKRRAFAHFESQNKTVDYPRAVTGLNIYRSILLQGGVGYAEAFQELLFAEFSQLSAEIVCRSQTPDTGDGSRGE